VGEGWLVIWTVNGEGPGGPVGYVAGRKVAGDGSLLDNALTLSTVFDEVANAAVTGNVDYLAAWAGIPDTGGQSFTTPNQNIYSRLARKTTQLVPQQRDFEGLFFLEYGQSPRQSRLSPLKIRKLRY
jgi:hypothetical protein